MGQSKREKSVHVNAFPNGEISAIRKVKFVGSGETARVGLECLVEETRVDEVIVASANYDHAARLRFYEILSERLKPETLKSAFLICQFEPTADFSVNVTSVPEASTIWLLDVSLLGWYFVRLSVGSRKARNCAAESLK
jgi:hypothetical protein